MTPTEPRTVDGAWVPRQHPDAHSVELDGDTVVLHEPSGRLHVLNPIAATIWQLCDGTSTAADIADLLSEAADGAEPEQVRSDVVRMIEEFHDAGLLGSTDDEADASPRDPSSDKSPVLDGLRVYRDPPNP